jgi:Ni/Fe-hydrogenase subunit HybB-like protein
MDRVRKFKLVLWLSVGLALSVAAARYRFGLGATTNLGDSNAWGLWVGFDVMGGVALPQGASSSRPPCISSGWNGSTTSYVQPF